MCYSVWRNWWWWYIEIHVKLVTFFFAEVSECLYVCLCTAFLPLIQKSMCILAIFGNSMSQWKHKIMPSMKSNSKVLSLSKWFSFWYKHTNMRTEFSVLRLQAWGDKLYVSLGELLKNETQKETKRKITSTSIESIKNNVIVTNTNYSMCVWVCMQMEQIKWREREEESSNKKSTWLKVKYKQRRGNKRCRYGKDTCTENLFLIFFKTSQSFIEIWCDPIYLPFRGIANNICWYKTTGKRRKKRIIDIISSSALLPFISSSEWQRLLFPMRAHLTAKFVYHIVIQTVYSLFSAVGIFFLRGNFRRDQFRVYFCARREKQKKKKHKKPDYNMNWEKNKQYLCSFNVVKCKYYESIAIFVVPPSLLLNRKFAVL